MDISWSPAEQAFQQEVRAFLAAELDEDLQAAGRLMTSVYAEHEASMRWQAILLKQGWLAPAWPVEYGGCDWTPAQHYIFASEQAKAGAPPISPMGIRMCAPALIAFGSEQQKQFFLPRMLSGEHFWCQGYSEPEAGSDLAALQMSAVDDGDALICNGGKIWQTHANEANWIFCLVRSSKEARPQQGISFVLIDMHSPGVEVRPIVSLSGEHIQNQVFFTDVRVPKTQVVGQLGEGWTVAKYLLEFERGGTAYSPGLHGMLEKLKKIATEERAGDGDALIADHAFRNRLADIETQVTALEFYEKKTMSALNAGQNPGASSSVMKLRGSECLQATAELAVQAIGYYANPYEPEARAMFSNAIPVGPDHSVGVMAKHLNSRASTIYAGASEIQRNIMAKLVLGL